MAVHPTAQQELIPGYVTVERLGAGGYGEVWKVEAPGGLHKAIKVVYGLLDEERAARELKALHHVKEVRHPFLLSLERIEVVDGRLMIVTELADGSLMDRFELCRKNGAVGLERDEMLSYLRDAADALDYMLQQHSLQHLDVKPENLLVVAGRTKVADFGLVKELADKTRSLVGAMTPTYAAPELFDGKASRQSDQYSLAIVYQEMLTGVLPFPGRSAAQLASQHQRNRPQLSALPAHDRDIIARALSKKPEDRFGSCREMAEALALAGKLAMGSENGTKSDTRSLRAEDTAVAKGGRGSTPVPGQIAPDCTEILSGKPASGGSKAPRLVTMMREEQLPLVQVGTRILDAPPPSLDPDKLSARPTLLIGVGGTGLLAVARLRERLIAEYGDAVVREAFPMLVVDTDPVAMKLAVAMGLDTQDVLVTPLRAPNEYRHDAEQLLKWIGRRWLFNIPKSCRTDGFRPLGRLALVDHAAQLVTRLRQRLNRVCGESAVRLLTGHTGKKPREETPRVCLVGASSGGTGGGMLLEMAYAVSNVARQQEHHIETCAFINHGTPQNVMLKQLATANTAALLRELQHYVRQGACGVSSDPRAALFDGEDFPFSATYFFHLGEELTSEDYHRRVEQVADYLYCDTTSPLGAMLDRCRAEEQDDEESFVDYRLRSFEVRHFTAIEDARVTHTERQLATEIVKLWLQEVAVEPTPAVAAADAEDAQDNSDSTGTAAGPKETSPPLAVEYSPMYYMNSSELAAQILRRTPTPASLDFVEPTRVSETPAEAEFLDAEAPLPVRPCTIWKGVHALREMARTQWSGQLTAEQVEALEIDLLKQLQNAKAEYVSMRAYYDETPQEIVVKAQKLAETVIVEYLESLRRKLYAPSTKLLPLVELLVSVAHFEAPKLMSQNTAAVPSELIKYGRDRPESLHDWGCQRRTAILGPATSDLSALREIVPERQPLIAHASDEHFWFCEEFADLSLAQLVDSLTRDKPEVLEATARLHVRGDIEWTSPAEIEVRDSQPASISAS